MALIDTILHPTDFSEGAGTALEHALHLARHFNAVLHVLHVVPAFGEDPVLNAYAAASGTEHFTQRLRADAEAELRTLAERHLSGVSVRRVITAGIPGAVITEYAAAHEIDVVVMGTHGRRGVRRLLLGSTAGEVVHRAPCHVLTVRRPDAPAAEPRPIQRILAPVDFNEAAGPLLRIARALASSYGAFLDVLHVIKPLPFAVTFASPMTIHDLVPDVEQRARTRLEALFAEAGAEDPPPAAFHVLEGHPARAIVQAAEAQQADLIVVAPRRLGRVEHALLGSVAEHVVRTATCPVFVAKAGPAA
ncbi:MAG: universal stress protein [Rhodothermales bacterium]|nr:universal stress protein [Rhodothermales bacterium]